MVIKPHHAFDEAGLDYVLTYYDDPQATIPSVAMSWMASTGVPKFTEDLRMATLDLIKAKGMAVVRRMFQQRIDVQPLATLRKPESVEPSVETSAIETEADMPEIEGEKWQAILDQNNNHPALGVIEAVQTAMEETDSHGMTVTEVENIVETSDVGHKDDETLQGEVVTRDSEWESTEMSVIAAGDDATAMTEEVSPTRHSDSAPADIPIRLENYDDDDEGERPIATTSFRLRDFNTNDNHHAAAALEATKLTEEEDTEWERGGGLSRPLPWRQKLTTMTAREDAFTALTRDIESRLAHLLLKHHRGRPLTLRDLVWELSSSSSPLLPLQGRDYPGMHAYNPSYLVSRSSSLWRGVDAFCLVK